MTRSAYWSEFQQAAIETKLARELPEHEAIAVLDLVLVPVHWKVRAKTEWRERSGVTQYIPGQVLHREWRPASEWETAEWENLPEEALHALGVFWQQGIYSIQIVEKIKDLPAAIRQRARHVPARKIARKGRTFALAGDAQTLAVYARRLSGVIQDTMGDQRPTPQVMEQASLELAQIALELEQSKTALKTRARQEIALALQGRFWEVPAMAGQAMADLLKERVRDYEIAIKSVELAEKWRNLMADIERRFRNCYRRLGQLGQRLQEMQLSGVAIEPSVLLAIAKEAHGIWIYLQEPTFNFGPYYHRLQEPEFHRLSRVLDHAKEGRASTVFNDIELAAAKLEAVAIGEKPTRVELLREKETLL